MSDLPSKKSYNPPSQPETKTDSTLINKAHESNSMRLNRELFYVQELLNSNTSWELEHKITNASNLKLRGIFVEDDVSFQINHSFGTGGMGDNAVGRVVNGVKNLVESAQSYAPITNSLDRIGNMVGDGIKNVGKNLKEGNFFGGNLMGKWLENAGDFTKQMGGDASEFLNKSRDMLKGMSVNTIMNGKFLAASDLIKTYQGTDAKFSLPDLRCWIFHNSQDKEKNVLDMVKAVTSTCMGDLTDVQGAIGLQHSPGNYEPDIQVLNKSHYDRGMGMKGTWNLTMGGYTIYNLLITSVDVTLSKFNALDSDGNDSGDPLYAELKISIEPASYISRDDIFNTIMHKRSTTNGITFVRDLKVPKPSSHKGAKKSGNSSKRNSGKNKVKTKKMDIIRDARAFVYMRDTKLTSKEKHKCINELCIQQAQDDYIRENSSVTAFGPEYDKFIEKRSGEYMDGVKENYGGWGKCTPSLN